MDELVRQGRVVQTAPGNVPMQKRYLDEMPGVVVQDIWTDLKPIAAQAAERLGYPTQKPAALLERIIREAATPAIPSSIRSVDAERPSRRLRSSAADGSELTSRTLAIGLVERRMKDTFGPEVAGNWKVVGEPRTVADAGELARRDRYQFQWWALDRVDARPKESTRKKGADRGVDGIINFQESPGGAVRTVLLQVKSGQVHRDDVATLKGDMEREDAEIGVLLSLEEPTEPIRKEAAGAGVFQAEDPIGAGRPTYPRVQLLTVKEILEGGKSVDTPSRATSPSRGPRSPPQKPGAESRS